MEILVGRVTANAKVNTTKNEKQVVNFSIAINDSYKAKGSDEVTKTVTYVNCAYWVSTGIAKYLTKGAIVELCGRISVSAWTNMDGDAKANLNLHVNNIKLHSSSRDGGAKAVSEKQDTKARADAAPSGKTEDKDLPF